MLYEFEVIGDIIGKERPRVNTYNHIVYTPTKTKDYETLIQEYFKIKYKNHKILTGRISIEITAYIKIPKNTSKKKRKEYWQGNIT